MSTEQPNSSALEVSLILKDLLKDHPSKLKSVIAKLGGSIKSTETYYSKKCADAIKPHVDAMLLDKRDREFLFVDYPKWTANTMRQKLESGLKYLVNELDDEKFTYAKWREGIKVCWIKDHGMLITHRKGRALLDDNVEFIAHIIKDEPSSMIEEPESFESKGTEWRDALIEWVKNSKNDQIFEKRQLALSEDDKIFIRQLCSESFIVRANTERIKIINNSEGLIEMDERIIIK